MSELRRECRLDPPRSDSAVATTLADSAMATTLASHATHTTDRRITQAGGAG